MPVDISIAMFQGTLLVAVYTAAAASAHAAARFLPDQQSRGLAQCGVHHYRARWDFPATGAHGKIQL